MFSIGSMLVYSSNISSERSIMKQLIQNLDSKSPKNISSHVNLKLMENMKLFRQKIQVGT